MCHQSKSSEGVEVMFVTQEPSGILSRLAHHVHSSTGKATGWVEGNWEPSCGRVWVGREGDNYLLKHEGLLLLEENLELLGAQHLLLEDLLHLLRSDNLRCHHSH